MSRDYLEKINELYAEYRNVIKPLIAEIEANYEVFPTALLNEIRAYNDHIARCFNPDATNDDIIKQVDKAKNHIVRMILDCYKYLNVYYNDRVVSFERETRRIDLTSIDNGEFYIQYKKLKQEAINKVRYAKKEECKPNVNVFEFYQDSYNAYVELYDFISQHLTKVNWARGKFVAKRLGTFVLWVLSVVIGAFLTNNNSSIIEAFSNIIFQK